MLDTPAEAGDHDRHTAPDQVYLDGARHGREERIGDVGNGQAYRGVRARAEAPSQQVRNVVQLLHRPANPFAGLFCDVGIIVEDP